MHNRRWVCVVCLFFLVGGCRVPEEEKAVRDGDDSIVVIVRRVATWFDPRATREELSAMLLGHPTHLKAKVGGENSMSGKAGYDETAKSYAGRGPDGKVKAGLPEPQCPRCKHDQVGNGG
jgi:hypothetical protein